MQKIICCVLLNLMTSSALAASNEQQFTIVAPQANAPLQIIDAITHGNMSIGDTICNNTTCSFKVKGNLLWQSQVNPDAASIIVGRDPSHACTFSFDNDPGIIIMHVKLQKVSCSGEWQVSNLQANPITILGQ